jgi:transposase
VVLPRYLVACRGATNGVSLRANDDETQASRKFTLEGATGSSSCPCPLLIPRSTALPVAAAPSSELSARPRRRTFTAQDKLPILAETDRAAGSGGIGAVLRREFLYSSMLTDWRKARDAGADGALAPAKREPKIAEPNPLAAALAAAKKENARLTLHLARAETIIDIQKKVAALLGILPTPNDSEP